jgi:O-acetyl-ADP-ribose deacetylase (regulator of RNase III)
MLRSAVHEALLVARGHRLDSVALPAISAGIFGFPKDRCARNMLDEIVRFAEVHQVGGPADIRVVLRDEDVIEAFLAAWDAGF